MTQPAINEALVAGSDYRVLENDRPEFLPAGRLLVPLDWLRPNPENPRDIDPEKFENLKRSIVERPEFLLKRPALVSDGPTDKLGGLIYGGNRRYDALASLYEGGWSTPLWPAGYMPVDVGDIDRTACDALLFVDNSEWASWNDREAAAILKRLETAGTDTTILGLDYAEVKEMLRSLESDVPPDQFRELDESSVTVNTTCPRCGYEWSAQHATIPAESVDP